MKKVKGIHIEHLGFDPIKQGDFIYHEGPLLSHFPFEEQYENHALTVRDNLLQKQYENQTFEKILQEVAQIKEQQSKTYSLLENIMGKQLNPL